MELRTFDPNLTWRKLLESEEFIQQAPEGPARELFREFILQRLPEVIGDQLTERLTVATMMETQRRVLRHYADTGFLGRVVDAMPEEAFGFVGRESVRQMLTSTFAMLVDALEGILHDVPAFLASQNVTDEQLLAHPRGGGLSAESMAAYRDGTLTVGGLLMTDPWKVLNFNKK